MLLISPEYLLAVYSVVKVVFYDFWGSNLQLEHHVKGFSYIYINVIIDFIRSISTLECYSVSSIETHRVNR